MNMGGGAAPSPNMSNTGAASYDNINMLNIMTNMMKNDQLNSELTQNNNDNRKLVNMCDYQSAVG